MRLEAGGHPEEVAADLIEGWSAVETALRSLVGGSALSGQMLIRELRTRHVITLEQANALAEFQAARDRAQRTDYRPTEVDVDSARQGFLKLEAGLMAATMTGPAHTPMYGSDAMPIGSVPGTGSTPGAVTPSPGTASGPRRSFARPSWLMPLLGLVALASIGAIGYWAYDRSQRGGQLAEGVELYRAGQRERAQAAFERAARENPKDALPHLYLSRMAREVGNLPLAKDEANKAIQLDQSSGAAMREMGSVLLTQGQNDLAVKFYARAIERDSTDKAAMGWLGCAMIRQGRIDVGQRFVQRAGQGDWSNCRPTMMPGQMPGQMPPGPYPPQGYPPGTAPQGYPQQYPQQPPPQGTYIPRNP